MYRLIHINDSNEDIETGLYGRDKELCKRLLQLFHKAEAYEEVKSTLQTFLDKKNKRKKSTSVQPVIYGIVVDLVSNFGRLKIILMVKRTTNSLGHIIPRTLTPYIELR